MSNRITRAQLDGLAKLINKLMNRSDEPFAVGSYFVEAGYGGVRLRVMLEAGGCHDVFYRGYMPKRELWDMMQGYRHGIEAVLPAWG